MLGKIQQTFSDIGRSLAGKSRITQSNIEDAVEQIKSALVDADVNLRVVRRFVNSTAEEAKGEHVLRGVNPAQQFTKIIYDKLVHFLGDENQALALRGPDVVSPVILFGLQGAGKTTTAAKLALHLKAQGRKPMIAACDFSRPAAVQQLQILAQKIDVPVFVDEKRGVLESAKKAMALAKKEQYDTLIIDSAGRMQLDDNLMKELESLNKAIPSVERLFVADSMTGQSAVNIVKVFNERIGITGVILTKFDSDTRGGAALSLKTVTGQPVKFIGTGEKLENFEVFHPDRIASRILGMGDILSLVEKAQQVVDEKEAMQMQAKLMSANFTLVDYLEQMRSFKKMGKAGDLAKMLPGVSEKDIEANFNEKQIAHEEAMILSMTKRERENPMILNPSRRKRIAAGSGMTPVDLNRFLNRFEKTKLQMKKLSKNKNAQAQLMKSLGV
ncbi:MAG: signal recognition particle protein [Spirochaetia bacterium]